VTGVTAGALLEGAASFTVLRCGKLQAEVLREKSY